ncbi:TPA: hypothetical protein JBL19_01530 [Legionella pneumophila]|nr:hypothetical protein [Legionella pneumophila subsp. fraseri]HAT1795653.1 hypothetical protein [Legionella pneumophila]MDW8960808.1 hypothetical protein [Legionella pneumophila subsp. fraseri]MDW9035169.1 hypothetical protein [Legionella pneumophila subsp. fraseri]MDW9038230.1 hypothetical protein [Legionella pneumophila subsp. fraseri]
MKKSKEKHQSVPESMTAGEPQTSSIALALQLFRKETEKKEVALEAAKTRCPVCFKEIAPKRLCSGHGSGASESDSATSDKTSEKKVSPGKENSLTKPQKTVETTDEWIGEFDSRSLDEKSFDPEIIAELINKGLLLIDNDRELMKLNIKLLCEPNSLTEEQKEELKKFIEAIITEFNKFKEENHLSTDCMQINQDEEGNILSLRINMPTLALYDVFIQRLANNYLAPTVQEKDEITKNQSVASTPLLMEPKLSPSTQGENIEKNEEEQEIFNPSPFKMTSW